MIKPHNIDYLKREIVSLTKSMKRVSLNDHYCSTMKKSLFECLLTIVALLWPSGPWITYPKDGSKMSKG